MNPRSGPGSVNGPDPSGRRGQSSVEFALIIPLVLVALLAVVQVALVAYAQLAVTHLAREVARAVAVDPHVDVSTLVEKSSPLGENGLVVEVRLATDEMSGLDLIRVSISYESSPIVEMFDPFSDHFVVRAEAVMAREP